MGRGKRNATSVISSSDDEDFLVKSSSKTASVPRTNSRKRPKKFPLSNSCPRPRRESVADGFDEVRVFFNFFCTFFSLYRGLFGYAFELHCRFKVVATI